MLIDMKKYGNLKNYPIEIEIEQRHLKSLVGFITRQIGHKVVAKVLGSHTNSEGVRFIRVKLELT